MYITQYAKVEYLEHNDAVLCEWKKFCKSDDYRNPLSYRLELINKHHCKTWVTDTSTGFENEEADTKWLLEVFMPKMQENCCEEIVFLMDGNSTLKDEIEGQTRELSEHFNVKIIDSFDDLDKD